MKLFSIFMFAFMCYATANTYSQKQIVSLNLHRADVNSLFKEIRKQTGLRFVYNEEHVAKLSRFDMKVEKCTVQEVLNKVFKNTSLQYFFEDDVIFIVLQKPTVQADSVKSEVVKGIVVDEKGTVLPGVTIQIKGTSLGVSTNVNGAFQITVLQDTVTLVFSFIGMETTSVKLQKLKAGEVRKELKVVMKEQEITLEDVVITGYANVKKTSFTGSATSVTREELKKVTSGNIISALQVFDPSLRMIKNNLMGADPNTLPEFYVRGRSGIESVKQLDKINATTDDISQYALTNNPNTPIFIMDGYEVSVEKVYDLDLNRVESVTILKDAAATAVYGSRASNGVVVIETVAPSPGRLRMAYYFTGSVTAPDLSDYNLMNAREKLEAELAAGLLDAESPNGTSGTNDYFQRLSDYRNKYRNVAMGIDTYWMSQPLQTQFNHKHSLYIDGGAESVRFGLGLNYSGQNGVMKESYRRTYGGDFKVDYRLKGFQLNNQVIFSMMKAQNSPYGSFSDYTTRQPYYTPKDMETGEYSPTIEGGWGSSGAKPNPLFEATLGNFDKSDYREFTNNLTMNAYFTRGLQLKAQLALKYKESGTEKFLDPNSSKYALQTISPFQKGELTKTRQEAFSWNTNVLLIYNNTIGNHNLNLSLGLNITEDRSTYELSSFRGFPSAQLHDQKYAKEIINNPSVSDSHSRLIGTFLFANYTWKDIYLMDVSMRFDGSSQFGSDQRWATFWSYGAGINLHKYAFLKPITWLNTAKIKGNYGQTGKVTFPPYAANHTYQLMLDSWHPTGIGGKLSYMGNSHLKWEKTNTLNLGIELSFFSRLSVNFSWYDKRTVDLITDVTIPSSTGFTAYKENMGEVLNRGYEFDVNYAVCRSKDFDVNLFVRGAHNKNEILKISDALKAYNDAVDDFFNTYLNKPEGGYSTPIMKYEEGGSLTSLFGMKSLGIAPANGEELFMNRDGSVTYEWNSAEQIILGNTEPDLQGSFGCNVRWKGFTLYTSFLFEYGGESYNQTLVNNVENVNLWQQNADRRVMTMRWQKPGDVTKLKSIKDRYKVTNPTSRFVQKNNNITFNSLSLGYDVNPNWVKKIGLNMLKAQFSMNDVATFSTVKQERGLSYPFARTFNFSLSASF